MSVPTGCECLDCDPAVSGCERDDAPVAFSVVRMGQEFHVCSRCYLRSDEIVERIHEEHDIEPYEEYDPLFALTQR